MASGFKINQQAVRQMARDLQKQMNKEMAKHPVKITGQVSPTVARTTYPMFGEYSPASNVTNYNGPVVQLTGNGNSAQLAWNNTGTVNQGGQASSTEQIAPGYEQIATVITDLLANLSAVGLDDADEADVRDTAETVLAEIVREEPDQGVIRRCIAAMKGYLGQIASGVAQAATDTTTAEGAEFARTTMENLSNALPF